MAVSILSLKCNEDRWLFPSVVKVSPTVGTTTVVVDVDGRISAVVVEDGDGGQYPADAYTAGTDTTATVLEWTFAELVKHPRVLKKVQDEVRMVLKGKQQINQDDIDNMKYLKAVLKETLRLHPPIPTLVPRVARQDVNVMGYDVAKGTMVLINAWAIARDPKMWDEPQEFRPERFLDSTIDFKGHDFDLIPFGAGRRGCPGISFAMTTNEHFLANLLHKFDWELPANKDGKEYDDLDMNERPGLTIRKKAPLLVVATPFSP